MGNIQRLQLQVDALFYKLYIICSSPDFVEFFIVSSQALFKCRPLLHVHSLHMMPVIFVLYIFVDVGSFI